MINEAFIEKKSRERLGAIKSAPTEISFSGTAYYVSADGDDSADGKSPENALRTLEKANSLELNAGDALLFRRGDIFRGSINAAAGATYSAFGEGAKPQLLGSFENAAELCWEKTDEFIWSVAISHSLDIGCIVFEGEKEWGYKKFSLQDLQMDRDFFHDIENNRLYLFSENGNPRERWADIELCPKRSGCDMKSGITVDSIVFKYFGAHGIGGSSIDYSVSPCRFVNVYNVTVKNCEFEWIGGSVLSGTLRYGNGIEIWGGCENQTIENCYFNQIYDTGITQQFKGACDCDEDMPMKIKNVTVKGCYFDLTTWPYEYYLTENNREDNSVKEDTKWGFENILIDSNIFRRTGYGWGNQRPCRRDCAHIKSWGHFNNAENFVISNNIFDRSDFYMLDIKCHFDECLPKLKDNVYCQYEGKGFIATNSHSNIFGHNVARSPKDFVKDEGAVAIVANR